MELVPLSGLFRMGKREEFIIRRVKRRKCRYSPPMATLRTKDCPCTLKRSGKTPLTGWSLLFQPIFNPAWIVIDKLWTCTRWSARSAARKPQAGLTRPLRVCAGFGGRPGLPRPPLSDLFFLRHAPGSGREKGPHWQMNVRNSRWILPACSVMRLSRRLTNQKISHKNRKINPPPNSRKTRVKLINHQ